MKLTLYTDGACPGNPGKIGGWSYIIKNDNVIIKSDSGILQGELTNNIMEYHAIINGLEEIIKYNPESVDIISDSQLCINQLNGIYKCESPNLLPLYKHIRMLIDGYKFSIKLVWSSRNNIYLKECDKLCKKAIDGKDEDQVAVFNL